MKRKNTATDARVVDQELLKQARLAVSADQAKPKVRPCVVCGDDVAPNSGESLCWVCRRLKISAWKDSGQMPAQE